MNNAHYPIPGLLTPTSPNYSVSKYYTKEDGSINLLLCTGTEYDTVNYSIFARKKYRGPVVVKDPTYNYTDKQGEMDEETLKQLPYYLVQSFELPEDKDIVIPKKVINGCPVSLEELKPESDNVYFILELPAGILSYGESVIQYNKNGKVGQYIVHRQKFGAHVSNSKLYIPEGESTGNITPSYPAAWGSPKVFLSDDGETCTVNYSDTDTVAVKMAYSKFKKVRGSFGGVTDFSYMFYYNGTLVDVSEIDFSKAVDCGSMFYLCASLTSVTLDLSSATNCSNMLSTCTSLTSVTLDLPSATNCDSLVRSCANLINATLYLQSAASCRYTFYMCTRLTTLTINIARMVTVDFNDLDRANKIATLENFTILEGGLASCTTFKMYATNTAITDVSIQNVIDALTDYSGTSTSATCQFPAGRLTEEQKTTLTAKGWTYTEDGVATLALEAPYWHFSTDPRGNWLASNGMRYTANQARYWITPEGENTDCPQCDTEEEAGQAKGYTYDPLPEENNFEELPDN